MNFQMINDPVSYQCNGNNITIEAGKNTNLFNDMCSNYRCSNFPFYYVIIEGDFVIRCKVAPELKATYDLGSIVVFENIDKWIKFAFENADSGYPSMVSVVTNDVSDDSNGEKIEKSEVWMQVIRKGNNFALHYSIDKVNWKMVRIFKLEMDKEVKVGFSAQSPIGKGCRAIFEGIEIIDNNYTNIRKPE
jgi:uncharacterized protein